MVYREQSAGKSSLLEAFTEIPFPKNDNFCIRFATEIILRWISSNSLIIKIIPDSDWFANEQESIKAFAEFITNFDELLRIIADAIIIISINNIIKSDSNTRAFTKDILSVVIKGLSRL